jgi:hypothetical protein
MSQLKTSNLSLPFRGQAQVLPMTMPRIRSRYNSTRESPIGPPQSCMTQDEVSELRPLDDIGENLSVRTGQEVVPSSFHARLKIQS